MRDWGVGVGVVQGEILDFLGFHIVWYGMVWYSMVWYVRHSPICWCLDSLSAHFISFVHQQVLRGRYPF